MNLATAKPADLLPAYEAACLASIYASADAQILCTDAAYEKEADATARMADIAEAIAENPARDLADIRAKLIVIEREGAARPDQLKHRGDYSGDTALKTAKTAIAFLELQAA